MIYEILRSLRCRIEEVCNINANFCKRQAFISGRLGVCFKGNSITRIDYEADLNGTSRTSSRISEAIQRWSPDNLQTGSYVTGESLLDAFASTLTENELRDRYAKIGSYPALQEVKSDIFGDMTKTEDLSNGETWNRNILRRLSSRAFITTEEGYFGLGTPSTKPGAISRRNNLAER
jgi:hypothetical protein